VSKLPGIQYTGTPSMGREDPYGPINVARAQSTALQSIGAGIGRVADAYVAIETEQGDNAATASLSELAAHDAEARTNPNVDERLKQFESAVAKTSSIYSKGLSGTATKAFSERFEKASTAMRDQLASDVVVDKYNEQRDITESVVLEAARQGHKNEAYARIGASQVFSDNEKYKIRQAVDLEHELGDIERTVASLDPQRISDKLEIVDNEDYKGPLQDSNRRTAVNELKKALSMSLSAEQARVSQEDAFMASELELGVESGVTTESDVDNAFWGEGQYEGRPIITGAKRTQLLGEIRDRYAKVNQFNDNVARVNQAVKSGVGLSPSNKDDIKAVNDWYDALESSGIQGQEKAYRTMEMISRTNIMPSKVRDDFERIALVGSPESMAYQADLYRALDRRAPQVVSDIGTDYKAVYQMYNSYINGGATQATAVEKSREILSIEPTTRAMRQQLYAQKYGDIEAHREGFQSELANNEHGMDISIMPTGAPDLYSDQAFAAYKAVEYAYYQLTGDFGAASEFALRDFKQIFSPSELNGEAKIMPYAPEREYNDIPFDELEGSLLQFYDDYNLEDKAPYIMPDEITARDARGERSYKVWYNDEFGFPKPFDVRWQPDAAGIKATLDEKSVKEQHKNRDFAVNEEGSSYYQREGFPIKRLRPTEISESPDAPTISEDPPRPYKPRKDTPLNVQQRVERRDSIHGTGDEPYMRGDTNTPTKPGQYDRKPTITFLQDVEAHPPGNGIGRKGTSHVAYFDSGGKLTIGYGHTGNVSPGQVITDAQATALLEQDTKDAEQAFQRLVNVEVNPNQRAAIVSLIFNIGSGAFAKSKARKYLNAGDFEKFEQAAFGDRGFIYVGKKRMPGLVKRREQERTLFNTLYEGY